MNQCSGLARLIACIGIAVAGSASQVASAAVGCTDLQTLQLPDVRIVTATSIEPAPTWTSPLDAGQQVTVSVPFCRLVGVIEKEIGFELWLPMQSAWTGRMLGAGNGGDAGFIAYRDLGRGVARGFASASTDTGHKRSDARWGLGHPDRIENYAHRAHHLLAVHAKKIIERYYAKPTQYAYFSGCSGGGMQGMNLAQRYPGDYNGIMAGASGYSIAALSARFLMNSLADEADPASRLTAAQWQQIADRNTAACDARDGVKDGVTADPRICKFEASALQGLTSKQSQLVRDAHAPLIAKGEQLSPGFMPGTVFATNLRQIGTAAEMFGDWMYQDANWNPRTFELGRELPALEASVSGLRFSNPDLSPLRRVGGKLITYMGWMDAIVPPATNIEYYESVVRLLGKQQTHDFFRSYMVPGMAHCGGGVGANVFGQVGRGDPPIVDPEHDMLSALIHWVEKGVAPERIVASAVQDGVTTMTRPLCPYPQTARYNGRGDQHLESSFTCR